MYRFGSGFSSTTARVHSPDREHLIEFQQVPLTRAASLSHSARQKLYTCCSIPQIKLNKLYLQTRSGSRQRHQTKTDAEIK